MLAIPLSGKISWRNPPFMTVLLIILNIFIYFAFQYNEEEKLVTATEYYFESGLAELEVSRYLTHRQGETVIKQPVPQFSSRDDQLLVKMYLKMMSDETFLHLLLSDQIIKPTDSEYRAWKSMRWDYQDKMDQVVSWHYGLRPAAPRLETWFSHMFLHGGIGHLLGNMIFLWLIGCMIEFGSGRFQFIALYLLGGLAAAGLFWALNRYSQTPLVGASGAISAIMGAFCVYYGLKKVRIFLTLGFYFNYLKFPALMMLPIWIGYEIFQMLTMKGSNVAYAAHIGGLAGGAGLTFLLSKIPHAVDRDAFEDDVEGDEPIMEQALRHMRNLEFDDARELFNQILAKTPANVEVMRHLFVMERQVPESDTFHKIAGRLLLQLCKDEATFEEAREIYRDYVNHARPPRLALPLYIRLSSILASLGDVKGAKNILAFLIKKAPHQPGIPSAFLKLAQAFQKKKMTEQHKSCLQLIVKRFPDAPEAQIAKRTLM